MENIGLANVKLRLVREINDQIYSLSVEQKPSNRLHGPIQLNKDDIKIALRDIIMTTNLDRLKKG